MGRKRAAGNERMGQYVQKRSSGVYELRFPIPPEARYAFRNKQGHTTAVVIESLKTTDLRIANIDAEARKTQLREQLRLVGEARKSDKLSDYLRWLYEYDIAAFRREREADEDRRRREEFEKPASGLTAKGSGIYARRQYGKALTSEHADERRAAAGWAADEYFARRGTAPDRSSPEYEAVLDECTKVLVDGVLAKEALERGRPEPEPFSRQLSEAMAKPPEILNANTEQGRLKLSVYFQNVYAPTEAREPGAPKGERNIIGKRDSVSLFTELLGDKVIGAITKGDLYQFLDLLAEYPDRRSLTGRLKKLAAPAVIALIRSGEIKLPPISPKTANKHVTSISAILRFAERRQHIKTADSRGVKARVEDGELGAGRSFTTAELNRIFALPLFAGCAGEDVEGGFYKPGPVLVRDDRFWIPLVLLFTGARSSEIIGMMTHEAVLDHETPHLVIQPNQVRQRLKNIHSKRMVPIHSRLIEFGFLDFVRARVSAGDERLFPMAEETSYQDGTTGAKVTRSLSQSLIMRQFNRTMLGQANARADGGSAKCFRNTFEQQSTSKISSDEMRQRLTGRKVVSTVRIYAGNIPRDPEERKELLARLKADIECITYDAVALDHLSPKDEVLD